MRLPTRSMQYGYFVCHGSLFDPCFGLVLLSACGVGLGFARYSRRSSLHFSDIDLSTRQHAGDHRHSARLFPLRYLLRLHHTVHIHLSISQHFIQCQQLNRKHNASSFWRVVVRLSDDQSETDEITFCDGTSGSRFWNQRWSRSAAVRFADVHLRIRTWSMHVRPQINARLWRRNSTGKWGFCIAQPHHLDDILWFFFLGHSLNIL